MAETADAIVIGGGANGASTAFHLAELGMQRVLLCEQGTLASGATVQGAMEYAYAGRNEEFERIRSLATAATGKAETNQ